MTYKEVQRRVAEIYFEGVTKSDDESGHILEDKLREDFIKYILEDSKEAKYKILAKLILSTNQFDFSRWCA